MIADLILQLAHQCTALLSELHIWSGQTPHFFPLLDSSPPSCPGGVLDSEHSGDRHVRILRRIYLLHIRDDCLAGVGRSGESLMMLLLLYVTPVSADGGSLRQGTFHVIHSTTAIQIRLFYT